MDMQIALGVAIALAIVLLFLVLRENNKLEELDRQDKTSLPPRDSKGRFIKAS